jgi:hypothetical protein
MSQYSRELTPFLEPLFILLLLVAGLQFVESWVESGNGFQKPKKYFCLSWNTKLSFRWNCTKVWWEFHLKFSSVVLRIGFSKQTDFEDLTLFKFMFSRCPILLFQNLNGLNQNFHFKRNEFHTKAITGKVLCSIDLLETFLVSFYNLLKHQSSESWSLALWVIESVLREII